MVFHGSLSDRKSPRLSRTLPWFLADLNYAVVWTIFTYPLISKFFSPFPKPLGIVSSAPITIGNSVTFMLHRFFVLWPGFSTYLSFRFLWDLLSSPSGWQSSQFNWFSFCFFFFFFLFLFLLTMAMSGLLAGIK